MIKAFAALWRLSFRNAFSTWRLVLLLVLGGGLVLISAIVSNALNNSDDMTADEIEDSINTLVDVMGLGLLMPIVALLFASATLGELRDEKSLVYVWLSPTPRLLVPLTATLVSFAMVAPITAASLTLSAAVSGIGNDYVIATLVAALLGSLAYCSLFVAGSLLVQRILGWGLGYVLLWEGLIGSLPGPLARLSVRRYTSSIVADWSDIDLISNVAAGTAATGTAATDAAVVAVVALAATAVVAVAVAALRFSRMTIE